MGVKNNYQRNKLYQAYQRLRKFVTKDEKYVTSTDGQSTVVAPKTLGVVSFRCWIAISRNSSIGNSRNNKRAEQEILGIPEILFIRNIRRFQQS